MESSNNVVRPPEAAGVQPEASTAESGANVVDSVLGGEASGSSVGVQQPVTTDVNLAQLPPVAQVQAPSQTADLGAPLVAADEEVIEQEWVQKAKKIVADTKDDPYRQEQEVGRLQAEYIKKRYGKDIKLVNDK